LKSIKKAPNRSRLLIQLTQGLRRSLSHRENRISQPDDKGSDSLLWEIFRLIQVTECPGAPLSHPAVVVPQPLNQRSG
jgi:hypothetical protein